jgi:hypothetical protein
VNWGVDCPSYAESHINVLELLTVKLAIQRWGEALRGTRFIVRTDNTATMAALNKGTSRSRGMMPIVRDIFWMSVKYDFQVFSVFLKGSENILADRISRLTDFECACHARQILAMFENCEVYCNGHMSIETYTMLQGRWTEVLINCG